MSGMSKNPDVEEKEVTAEVLSQAKRYLRSTGSPGGICVLTLSGGPAGPPETRRPDPRPARRAAEAIRPGGGAVTPFTPSAG